MDEYGWTDIRPTCEFLLDYEDEDEDRPGSAGQKRKPWRYRWSDDVRDEVLGRLLELNAQRAKEEERAGKGFGGGTGPNGLKVSKAPKKTNKAANTPLLGD